MKINSNYFNQIAIIVWLVLTLTACQMIPVTYQDPSLLIPDWDKLTEAQKQAIVNNYIPRSEYSPAFYYSPFHRTYYDTYWNLGWAQRQTESERQLSHSEPTEDREPHESAPPTNEPPLVQPKSEPPATNQSIECGAGASCKQFKLR